MPAASRRSMLTAATALALPAPVAALAPNPDADLIAQVAAFLSKQAEREAAAARLFDLSPPYSPEVAALFQQQSDGATAYREALDAISTAEPVTAEGMVAKATAILWHERHTAEDEPHGWNLALSVLAFLGAPIPAWVEAA